MKEQQMAESAPWHCSGVKEDLNISGDQYSWLGSILYFVRTKRCGPGICLSATRLTVGMHDLGLPCGIARPRLLSAAC